MDTHTQSADELLKANAEFANHLYSFITPMSLNCAVQLGIADAIHSHGNTTMTLSDLTSSLSIHPTKSHFLPHLMRILTHSGYFKQIKSPATGEPSYTLTPLSRLLLTDHPYTAKPYILFAMSRHFMDSWMGLSKWFKNGTDPTPFHTAHGVSLWEMTRVDGEMNGNINDAMAGDSRMVASVLVDCKDEELGRALFGGVRSVVDVGGGTGGMARALAAAYKEVDWTVLDLPQVVQGLEESTTTTTNLRFLAGDMFDHVPSTDVVMLKWLLHDWNDEDCVKILKQCRKAITSNQRHGKVIIIEIVINEEEDNDYKLQQTQLFYDMQMMGILAGKERSEREWKKIFDDAEYFGGYKIYPVLGFRSLVEVYP